MKALVIAGGPSANVALFAAMDRKPDKVWGCNRAIRLWRDLDCYVATDPNNQKKYQGDMEEAATRGVQLWLPPWYKGANLPHQPFEYDTKNPLEYSRDKIAHGRAVGLVTLQLALRENPETVMLVGFDGYTADWRSKHEIDSKMLFKQIEEYPGGRPQWWAEHNAYMQKVLDAIIADRTDVRFVWFQPSILTPPKAKNVEIVL